VATESEVRWTHDNGRFVHSTADATRFVRDLFRQYGDAIGELEVRRASLEDTYMAMVREHESGQGGSAAQAFEEVTR
jgi:ABC-2 type transport system ATP-binding protein